MIEITIDGRKIQTESNTTVLKTALANGIYIPNLCYDKRLDPYGGCRLCLIEVEGQKKLLTACSTPVENGMVVYTENEKILKARKTVLELLLVHHPLDCPICDKSGECQLQDLAFKYGHSENRFAAERHHEPESIAAPLVERNPNRCILCGKCVRVCSDNQGVGAINLIGRGFKSKVSPAFEETLDCEFCGQCIDACPVGALGSKPYRFRSRVWFMDEFPIVCPYCGCGCITNISIREGRIIRARGKEGIGINDGNLCTKGRFGVDYVHSNERLATPLIKKDCKHVPVSWEEALDYVMKRLIEIKSTYGASAVGAIGSQRCTMEDNYMFQRFMREVIGTDNIDSGARFGYAQAHDAFRKAFGRDYHPVGWDSALNADFILVAESDITSTLPVWGLNFIKAKRNGANLVAVNPKETKLARNSSKWLQTKPASSIYLFNALMKVIVDEGLYNREKASAMPGFDSLIKGLEAVSLASAAEATGLTVEEIIRTARDYAGADRRLISLTLGSSENTKGANTLLAAANLINLMNDSPDTLLVPAEYSNTLGMWNVGVRPLSGGMNAYDMLYRQGALKAMYIMGENPLLSFPDALSVEDGLRSLEFLVVQDIFMTDTAKMADVVLPASSWAEKEGSFMSATGSIQRIPKLISETGQSIPDWKVFRNLSRMVNKDAGLADLTSIRAAVTDMMMPVTSDSGSASNKTSFVFVSPETYEKTDIEYPLILITENLFQHSGALSVLSKNLDSVVADAYLEINPADAGKYRIANDRFVKVSSRRGSVYLKAMVSEEAMEGTVLAPVHFPHAKVNVLTHPSINGEPPVDAVKVEPA